MYAETLSRSKLVDQHSIVVSHPNAHLSPAKAPTSRQRPCTLSDGARATAAQLSYRAAVVAFAGAQ